PPLVDEESVIELATAAMDDKQYDQAVFLLKQALLNDYHYHFIDLNAMLQEAEEALEWAAMEKEVELEYRQIVILARSDSLRSLGCKAFAEFRQKFPEYDPNGVAEICAGRRAAVASAPVTAPVPTSAPTPKSAPTPRRKSQPRVPKIDMADIPAGAARVEALDEPNFESVPRVVNVEAFRVSRYPITNAQFKYFLDAPDGYRNERWWGFTNKALAWWKASQQPLGPKFPYKITPRENVSWYAAVAFCQWLGMHYRCRFLLPTLAQWQRAVQGDDERLFPWGDEYDPSRCNTRESGLRKTTPVNHYEGGASPYGVYDLAGNVWEWCMDAHKEEDILTGRPIKKRAVVGGSHVSPLERAQVGYRFFLHPQTASPSIGFRIVEMIET
ncbi:MAG: SUMF1/EgtB/PvdO family nonheme iron enzyme, partial [Chloroflexota bacterium]